MWKVSSPQAIRQSSFFWSSV